MVPPPGERVELLRAFHAHAHFVVSDPAGGAAAQLLALESGLLTPLHVYYRQYTGSAAVTSLDASLKVSFFS